MTWNIKTDKKINDLFKNDKKTRDKLLAHDLEVIRELGKYANSGFTSEEIVECYENNSLDYLYQKAKRKLELIDLFYDLIVEEKPKELKIELK